MFIYSNVMLIYKIILFNSIHVYNSQLLLLKNLKTLKKVGDNNNSICIESKITSFARNK